MSLLDKVEENPKAPPAVLRKTVVAVQQPVNQTNIPAPIHQEERMPLAALVFLDDPLARKLAVAWTTTGGDEEEWLEAAGISPAGRADALRICQSLLRNGICQAGGVTDEKALAYIKAIVSEPLTRGRGRGKAK